MIKKLGLTVLTTATLLLTGCGSGSSATTSAESILKGKTFYYTDGELNDAQGYYKDVFNTNSFIETEHSEDGTELNTETTPITYSGNKITVDDNGEKFNCTVTQSGESVAIDCSINNFKQIFWTTIKDAKSHPQP